MANETEKTESKAAPKAEKARPSWVWVLNNEERGKSIHLPGKMNEGSSTFAPGPLLPMVPGWNLLDAAQWETAKKNEQVQRELQGEIPHMNAPEHRRECSGKPYLVEGPVVADKLNGLQGIEEREAKTMIREIFDDRLLRQLLTVEKRAPVAVALREALEKIEKAARSPSRS